MKKVILCAMILGSLTVRAQVSSTNTNVIPPSVPALSEDDPAWDESEPDLWQDLAQRLFRLPDAVSTPDDQTKKLVLQIMALSRLYLAKYPDGPNILSVKYNWAYAGELMMVFGQPGGPSQAEIDKMFDDVVNDPQLPEKTRAEYRATQLHLAIQTAASETGDASLEWDKIDAMLADLQKQFGPDFAPGGEFPAPAILRREELQALKNQDPTRYNAMVKKLVDDPASFSTEPDLWRHFQTLQDEFQADYPAHNDDAETKSLIQQIVASARAYLTRYPSAPHVVDVKSSLVEAQHEMIRMGQDGAPSKAEVDKMYDDLAKDPQLTYQNRGDLRSNQLWIALDIFETKPGETSADWDEIGSLFDKFEKEFGPDSPSGGVWTGSEVMHFRREEVQALKWRADARYEPLVKALSSDPIPEVATMAKLEQRYIDRIHQLEAEPLDLSFPAVDGTLVYLTKLRGKVVLIDFWAICPACREDAPKMVTAYKKYHDLGFEIIGVSFDKDKQAMLSLAKSYGMTWPEYFDGQGWDNGVVKYFGTINQTIVTTNKTTSTGPATMTTFVGGPTGIIQRVPTMWLVDRQGKVVTTYARENPAGLSDQIEKLLAEPVAPEGKAPVAEDNSKLEEFGVIGVLLAVLALALWYHYREPAA